MRKVLKAREGFTLIELMIVIAVIGILAAVLIPYTFRAQDRARETGVVNAARAIQTGLEMYASNQISAPWYPDSDAKIKSLTALVSPIPMNPFSQTSYLTLVTAVTSTNHFILGGSATTEKGVIEYVTDGNSYTLILYGANGSLNRELTGGH